MPLRFASLRGSIGPCLAITALTVASCGSRTGLFLPDPAGFGPDPALSADAGDEAGTPCVPGRFDFELALTQLMFVLDRSGSMAFSLDGRTDVPPAERRWFVLQNALRKTIEPFDQEIAMGAKFFPEVVSDEDLFDSERACRTETGVGIEPRRGNAGMIINSFDVTQPRGGTPTAEAVRLAARFLTQQRSVARAIVLATDGGPNCNGDLDAMACVCTAQVECSVNPNRGRFSCLDDERAISAVREVSTQQKIPVYVIGIGSTERPEFLRVLDDMAVAGGRPRASLPRHYNAQSEDDLTNALGTIRDSAARCTYLTPSAPTDPDQITVQIDGVVIARDQTKTNGWDWVDKTYGELAFFGDACRAARGAPPAGVSGVVRCEE